MKCDSCHKQVNPAKGLHCTGTTHGNICSICYEQLENYNTYWDNNKPYCKKHMFNQGKLF